MSYKDGKEWASTSVRTADAPAKLELSADRARIEAGSRDLSFVTVRVLDKNGLPVPTAKNSIRFTVEGPGEIVATDNGDPTSFVQFQSPERAAFNGLALAIIRGKPNQTGKITVRAASAGLEGGSVVLSASRVRK